MKSLRGQELRSLLAFVPEPTTQREAKRRERGPSLPKALSAPSELIALLPGFLGFDRLGGFGLFADHMAATLRGAFELKTGRRTPVVALSSFPSASLAQRQQELLRQLSFWTDHHRVQRIKLVGHSTGGVDAYLLLGETRIDGDPWSADERRLRAHISHVVTMGAPFLGTTLASASVVHGFYQYRGSLVMPALRDLARLSRGAFTGTSSRQLRSRLAAAGEAPVAVAKFLHQLISHHELLAELSPQAMSERLERVTREHDAKLSCFASYVPPPVREVASELFYALYALTSEAAGTAASPPQILENCKLLEAAPILGRQPDQRPQLDAHSSDGVVNTLRQLPPDVKKDEVAGLVMADHADLLGYFDHFDARSGRETQNSVFRSGARFRDDDFFELFSRIARYLA